jgi:hypothetical protein
VLPDLFLSRSSDLGRFELGPPGRPGSGATCVTGTFASASALMSFPRMYSPFVFTRFSSKTSIAMSPR